MVVLLLLFVAFAWARPGSLCVLLWFGKKKKKKIQARRKQEKSNKLNKEKRKQEKSNMLIYTK